MPARAWPTWVPLAVLLLASLSGNASGKIPEGAFYEYDGVPYFFAQGNRTTGHFAIGPAYNGTPQLDFTGCSVGQFRTDLDNGRASMVGVGPGGVHLRFDIDEFDHDATPEGGIAEELRSDGGEGNLSAAYPMVDTLLSAFGTGSLIVNGDAYDDPVTGSSKWDATFSVTTTGFRDDATGAILEPDGSVWDPGNSSEARTTEDDLEIHLRFESPPNANTTSGPEVLTFVPAGDLPDGTILPAETYGQAFEFPNTKFGGRGHIEIATSSYAPEGENDLLFTLLSPTGVLLGESRMQPALLQNDQQQFDFPLEEFGNYYVLVTGQISLAQYEIEVTQSPPDTAAFHLWWENVTFGRQGYDDWATCQSTLGSINGEVVAYPVVMRPGPPGMLVRMLVAAVAATVVGIVVATRFISDSRSATSFLKASGRR
jgi:hypothetical protein